MDISHISTALSTAEKKLSRGAAVVIPLIPTSSGLDVLFELRAFDIDIQPGEVCLPGGHIEPGETAYEAALRELEEELVISRSQLTLLGELGGFPTLSGAPFNAFVAQLTDYNGSWDSAEVDHTFTIPLDFFLTHEPRIFTIEQSMNFPNDFPFDRIPKGRNYPWANRPHAVPFYLETEPLVWGLTARVMQRLCAVLTQAH